MPQTISNPVLVLPQLKWRQLVAQDATVKAIALDEQLHAKFQHSKTLGKPQYDIAFQD